MSTLDSTINTIASNLTIDIYNRFINPGASPRTQLWVFRVNVVAVGALAAAIYYVFPVMIELFWLGGRIMGASAGPVLVALVLFPPVRRAPKSVFCRHAGRCFGDHSLADSGRGSGGGIDCCRLVHRSDLYRAAYDDSGPAAWNLAGNTRLQTSGLNHSLHVIQFFGYR